jgi:hypothetical protein
MKTGSVVGIGSLFLLACGGDADPLPLSTLGPQNGPPSAAAPLKPQSIAIEVRTPSTVYLQAQPNSLCRLQEAGGAHEHGALRADERGVVRTTLTAQEPGSGEFKLDCEAGGAGGARTLHAVTITATTDAAALAATQEAMAPFAASKPGTYRPPLTDDPMSYRPGWLLENGYGRRPDPKKYPDLYARWARSAAQEGRIVAPAAVSMSRELIHGPNERQPGETWAGILGPYYGPTVNYHFDDAWVEFQAPPVTDVFTSFSNTEYESTWAGIGGNSVPDGFWQAGVDGVATTTCGYIFGSFCVTSSSYYSWAEANAGANIYPGFHISANDAIYAEVWVCNPTDGDYTNIDPEDPNASLCYLVQDFTTSQSNTNFIAGTVANLIGKTNVFHTAEAMVENPSLSSGPSLLAVFPRLTLQFPGWCNSVIGGGLQGCGTLASAPGAYTYQLVQNGRTLATSCVTNDTSCSDSGSDVWVTYQASF